MLLKPEPRSGTASLLLLFSVKAATSQSRFEERRHISTAEWEEGLRRWGLIYPTVEVLVLYCCCNKLSHTHSHLLGQKPRHSMAQLVLCNTQNQGFLKDLGINLL